MENMTAKEVLNLIDWLRANEFDNDKSFTIATIRTVKKVECGTLEDVSRIKSIYRHQKAIFSGRFFYLKCYCYVNLIIK